MIFPFHLVIEFAQNYSDEFKRAFQEFIPDYNLAETQNEEIKGLFVEWLIFEYERPSKMSFLIEYVLRNPDKLPEAEIQKLEQIVSTNWYSDFQLIKTRPNYSLTIEDVFTGKIYEIFDKKASQNSESKGLLTARVALVDGKYYFVGSNPIFAPIIYTERLKKIIRGFKKEKKSAKDTAIMIFERQKNPPKPPPLLNKKEIQLKKIELKEEYIKQAKKYGAKLSFDELIKLVLDEKTNNVLNFWKNITKKGIPEVMFIKGMPLFQDIWNYFPHKILGNVSPAEMRIYKTERKINKRPVVDKEVEMEFRRILSILMIGNREEVRSAKKELEKFWHKDTEGFKGSAPIVLEYLSSFDQIEKIENQSAFLSGLNLFFLALGDEYFDILSDFTLKTIQHPNGTIREAIRKTADWLYISLSSRAEPFSYPIDKKLTEDQKAMQTQAQSQYINLVTKIEFLIDKYDEKNKNIKYIDEMKPSINKSLQLLWSRLTESPVYKKIIKRTLI